MTIFALFVLALFWYAYLNDNDDWPSRTSEKVTHVSF